MLNSNTNLTAKQTTRDMLLALLTISSGAIDAISFLALDKVFSAFMTGNIAFLGLRVAGASSPETITILSSILGFALGVFIAVKMVGPSKQGAIWTQRVTVTLAVALIPHAFFQIAWFASDGEPGFDVTNILLALWATAMGMQSAAVRTLHVDGVFTTAATATFIFLVGDLASWKSTVAERRRMVQILVSLFIGATIGGLLLVHAHKYAPVFPFVLAIATVLIASIVMRETVATDLIEPVNKQA